LIEHYFDHNQGDKAISISGFVKMHYFDNHLPDGDEQEDNNLPFKTSAYQLSTLSFVAPSVSEVKTQSISAGTVYPIYLQPYRLRDNLSDIFHPPRCA
jgi:hypothetical protein